MIIIQIVSMFLQQKADDFKFSDDNYPIHTFYNLIYKTNVMWRILCVMNINRSTGLKYARINYCGNKGSLTLLEKI